MKLLTVLLSICLLYTSTFAKTYAYKHSDFAISTIYELKKQYPDAIFLGVNLEQYNEYAQKGKIVNYKGKNLIWIDYKNLKQDNIQLEEFKPTYNDNKTPQYSKSFISTDGIFDGEMSKEGFFIFLVGVGVIVFAVLIINGLLILVDVVRSDEKLDKWFEIGTTGSYFSYTKKDTELEKSSMYGGLVLSTGLRKSGGGGIGFICELGHLDLSLGDESTLAKRYYGAYAMAGATFRHYFGKSNTNFHLDFMAGKSDLEYVDVMGVIRGGFNFQLFDYGFLDFNVGLNYLGLKELTYGYIKDDQIDESYNVIYGMGLGYSF